MILDKLIADKSRFAISYTSAGLLVNQAPLPGYRTQMPDVLPRVYGCGAKGRKGDCVYSVSSGAEK